MAIFSTAAGASLFCIGAYLSDIHHPGGVFVLVIGAVQMVLSLAIFPMARRRAKKGLPENLSKMNLQTWLSIFSIGLIGPGVADALNNKFSISSAVFIALGCVVYAVNLGIALHRRRRRAYDQLRRKEYRSGRGDEAV